MRPYRPQATTHSRTSEPPSCCSAHRACGLQRATLSRAIVTERGGPLKCRATTLEDSRYQYIGSTNLTKHANTSRNHRLCDCHSSHSVLHALFHLQDVDVCSCRKWVLW